MNPVKSLYLPVAIRQRSSMASSCQNSINFQHNLSIYSVKLHLISVSYIFSHHANSELRIQSQNSPKFHTQHNVKLLDMGLHFWALIHMDFEFNMNYEVVIETLLAWLYEKRSIMISGQLF